MRGAHARSVTVVRTEADGSLLGASSSDEERLFADFAGVFDRSDSFPLAFDEELVVANASVPTRVAVQTRRDEVLGIVVLPVAVDVVDAEVDSPLDLLRTPVAPVCSGADLVEENDAVLADGDGRLPCRRVLVRHRVVNRHSDRSIAGHAARIAGG